MVQARTVRRVVAALLAAGAAYLVGLTVVLSRFSASMREFDGEPRSDGSVVLSVLVPLAAGVLVLAAIFVLKASRPSR